MPGSTGTAAPLSEPIIGEGHRLSSLIWVTVTYSPPSMYPTFHPDPCTCNLPAPSLHHLRSWSAWEIERAVVAEAGLADAAWSSRIPADGASFPPVWCGLRSVDHQTLRSFGGMCLWSTALPWWPFRPLPGRAGGAARGFRGWMKPSRLGPETAVSLAARGDGTARPPGGEGGPDGPLFWRPPLLLGGPWAASAPRKDKYPWLAACHMQMGPREPDVCDLRWRAPHGSGQPHDAAMGRLCEPACRSGNLAGARMRVVAGGYCRMSPKGAAGQRHA